MTSLVHANASRMQRWGSTMSRQRWDYCTHDHAISHMLNTQYFVPALHDLNASDLIYVIDKDENEVILRVDYVDQELREVGLSIYSMVHQLTVDGTAYRLRHAGGRGRGTRWQIVDAEGAIVKDDIIGKKTAERELAALLQEELSPAA